MPQLEDENKETFEPTIELGGTGLNNFGGYIFEEELRQLRTEPERRQIFKEMSQNDPVVGGMLHAIDMLIRQVTWNVQAASDDLEDENNKEFIEECMKDMSQSWEDLISEVMSFLVYGWSYFELVYKFRRGHNESPRLSSGFNDGRLGWRKIPIRSQDSLSNWEMQDDGGISGMVQRPAPSFLEYFIPIEKSLLFRSNTFKNNPESTSILRTAYTSYFYKKRIQGLEAIGIERELNGIPLIYGPSRWTQTGAPAGEKAAYADLKNLAKRIKMDEQAGIVLPSIFDDNGNRLLSFELINAGGKRAIDASAVIERHDQRIAMSILADFMLLGTGKVGSFALAETKQEIFQQSLEAWTGMIASVFNRHAIPRLFTLNGMTTDKMPKIVPANVSVPDLEELGKFISDLSGAGIDLSNDIELENQLRESGGLLPRPEDTEENFDTLDEEEEEDETTKKADELLKILKDEREPKKKWYQR